jgi:hypothetical protein
MQENQKRDRLVRECSKETPLEQRARVEKTPQGRALLELIGRYPTKKDFASALGSSVEYISRCLLKGEISRSGALLADKKGLIPKEALRPDVTDWESVPPGLLIGAIPSRNGEHQILLRDLAIHFGSVKALCKAAGFDVATFHNYNNRNMISAQGKLKLLAIKGLSADISARVTALIDESGQKA